MRRGARIDANQPEIVLALRKRGAVVFHVHTVKNFCDLIVAYNGKVYMVEIKDGTLPPSARKLTSGELKCKESVESVGCTYNVITSVEDALSMLDKK